MLLFVVEPSQTRNPPALPATIKFIIGVCGFGLFVYEFGCHRMLLSIMQQLGFSQILAIPEKCGQVAAAFGDAKDKWTQKVIYRKRI